MNVKYNVDARAYVVKVRRGDAVLSVVYWAESEKALRDRLREEFSQKPMEIVSIKERSA